MIIFGTRGVKSTIQEGEFSCPQCADNKPYKHKKVTRYFTLYFIPLIPLGQAGEYVECQSCKGTYVPRVLDHKPHDNNEFQAIFEKAMAHSMILMMLADGDIEDKEMAMVHKIINKFGQSEMPLADLEKLVTAIKRDQEPVHTYLSRIGHSLNEQGKEIIMKCALAVAAADGKIDHTEKQLIKEIAHALEMTPSHLRGLLQDITQEEPIASKN